MKLFLFILILFLFFCVFHKYIRDEFNRWSHRNIFESLCNIPIKCPDGWPTTQDGSACIVPFYKLPSKYLPDKIKKILWLDANTICKTPVGDYYMWVDQSSIKTGTELPTCSNTSNYGTIFYTMGTPTIGQYPNKQNMNIVTFSNTSSNANHQFAYTDNVPPDYKLPKEINKYSKLVDSSGKIKKDEITGLDIEKENTIYHKPPNNFVIGNSSFGMFILCKINSPGHIFSKCKNGSTTQYPNSIGDIEVYATGNNPYTIHFNIQDGTNTDNQSPGIKQGDWCLLELIYDQNTGQCSFYCNSKLAKKNTIRPNTILNNNYNMVIAASNDSNGNAYEREITFTKTTLMTDSDGNELKPGSIVKINKIINATVIPDSDTLPYKIVTKNNKTCMLFTNITNNTLKIKLKLKLEYTKYTPFANENIKEITYNETTAINADVMIIGGGGSGGDVTGGWEGGGGGGAGQLIQKNILLPINSEIPITIGSGGKNGSDGNPSSLIEITAGGGGRGGIGSGGTESKGNVGVGNYSSGVGNYTSGRGNYSSGRGRGSSINNNYKSNNESQNNNVKGSGGGGNGWARMHEGGSGGGTGEKTYNKGGDGEWTFGGGGGGGLVTKGEPGNDKFGGLGGKGMTIPEIFNDVIDPGTVLCSGGCGGGNRYTNNMTLNNNSTYGAGGQQNGDGNAGIFGGGGGGAGGTNNGKSSKGGDGGGGLVIIRIPSNVEFLATLTQELTLDNDPNQIITVSRTYSNNSPTDYFNGSIAEILAYTYDSIDGEKIRKDVETYFLAKWDLYYLFTTEEIDNINAEKKIGKKPFISPNQSGSLNDTNGQIIPASENLGSYYTINFQHDMFKNDGALTSWLNKNSISWDAVTTQNC